MGKKNLLSLGLVWIFYNKYIWKKAMHSLIIFLIDIWMRTLLNKVKIINRYSVKVVGDWTLKDKANTFEICLHNNIYTKWTNCTLEYSL